MSNEPTPGRRLGWMRVFAPIAAFIDLWPATSRAQTEDREAIQVETDGPIACTTADDFFERVHRRVELAQRARPGEAARTFTIAVQGTPPALRGRLIIAHPDGRATNRDVTGESCDEVVDALALITAVDIDPRYVMPPPLEKLDLPIPPPPPERPAPALPEPPGGRWQWLAGASIATTGGIAPSLLFGTPIFLEWARPSESVWSPAFALGFERTFNRTTTSADADATFNVIRGTLQACPVASSSLRLRLGPCVRVEAGALHAEGQVGKSVRNPGSETRAWVAGDLAGRATLGLGSSMYLDVQLGVGTPFVQPYRFQVDPNISLGEVRRVIWRAGLGFEVRFM